MEVYEFIFAILLVFIIICILNAFFIRKEKVIIKDNNIPPHIGEKNNETLIYVHTEYWQLYVLKTYGVRVPMWMVFDSETKLINSHLYFEMWEPSKDYINK